MVAVGEATDLFSCMAAKRLSRSRYLSQVAPLLVYGKAKNAPLESSSDPPTPFIDSPVLTLQSWGEMKQTGGTAKIVPVTQGFDRKEIYAVVFWVRPSTRIGTTPMG
jgi:hypothetical protein